MNESTEKKIISLEIIDGCIEHLSFESHRRGKNWIGVVESDRSAPGGFKRRFLQHCRTKFYRPDENVQVGRWLEMGGDYYTGSGKKLNSRRYFFILSVSEANIELRECELADVGKWPVAKTPAPAKIPETETPASAPRGISGISDEELIEELKIRLLAKLPESEQKHAGIHLDVVKKWMERGTTKANAEANTRDEKRKPNPDHAHNTRRAWEIARQIAEEKGGKPTQHMKEAWKILKERIN